MINLALRLLSSRLGPWLIVGLLGTLVSCGLYLQHSSYQRGYKIAVSECEAEKAIKTAEVLEYVQRLQEENQRLIDEMNETNRVLSDELNKRIQDTEDRINDSLQETPIEVNGSCDIDYGTVSLLDDIAAR